MLVLPSLLYRGFRTWKLALFSIFQTVMDVVLKAQSWSQFRGLNTKEMTSCPACGCVQIGSAFCQFLHYTVMVTVREQLRLNKHNWKYVAHIFTVLYVFQWLTTLLWCSLVERNNSPNKDHHHLMSEMCSPVVLFLESIFRICVRKKKYAISINNSIDLQENYSKIIDNTYELEYYGICIELATYLSW